MDYKGDYEVFLENNEEEAEKIAAIEEARREVEKSQIKAKSKVRVRRTNALPRHSCHPDVQGRKSQGEEGESKVVCQQGSTEKRHQKRQALELIGTMIC